MLIATRSIPFRTAVDRPQSLHWSTKVSSPGARRMMVRRRIAYALKVAAPPAVGVVRLSGAAVTAVDDCGDCLLVAGTPVRDLLDHANVLSIAASI
jgi:hypothetical protein